MELFFSHNGISQQGPFDVEGLKLKNINKDTPIWSEGKCRWTTAGKVKELQFLFNNTTISTMPNYMIGQNGNVSTQSRVNANRSFLRVIGIIISFGIAFYFNK